MTLAKTDGIGDCKTGELNSGPLRNSPPHVGGLGNSSVSDQVTPIFFLEVFNSRQYPQHELSVHTSIGWESLDVVNVNDDGITGFVAIMRTF